MNRILEFSPAPEEAVVSRILVMVHKAVDQHFPDAQQANRQFTKTVFSEEDFESTAINRLPIPQSSTDLTDRESSESNFDQEVETGEILAAPPEPPEPPVPAAVEPPSGAPASPEYNSMLDPMRGHLESEPASKILTNENHHRTQRPDWVARGLGALIIAGAILLILLLFASP